MIDYYYRNYRNSPSRLCRAIAWCRWYAATGQYPPLVIHEAGIAGVCGGRPTEADEMTLSQCQADEGGQAGAPTPPGAGSRFRQRKE